MKNAEDLILHMNRLATGGSAMEALNKRLALENLICGPLKAAHVGHLGVVDKVAQIHEKAIAASASVLDPMIRKQAALDAALRPFKNVAADVDRLTMGLEKPSRSHKEDHEHCPHCGK